MLETNGSTKNVMQDIIGKLNSAIHAISDHGNVAASKFITYFGISGSSVGVASRFANQQAEPEFLWFTLTEWGSIVGIAGGLSLVLKFAVDWHYKRKQDRREQEAHNRDMRG